MRYQVGGSLRSDDPTYVVRKADQQLYQALKEGEFCYVLNSRQMGKSSLLERTRRRLEEDGDVCAYIDITQLGSEQVTPAQWYRGIATVLFYEFNLFEFVNLKQWWEQEPDIPPVQKLDRFIETVLLPNVLKQNSAGSRIYILIDEIDSLLSLPFSVNDFFAWMRHCYQQRVHNPEFNRLGFALFGVATPSNLMRDKRRTPFNIGRAIALHGFQPHEVDPLIDGIAPYISQPEAVLREILHWTNGQPFLTQKLCQMVLQANQDSDGLLYLPPGGESFWVEQLVRSRVIQQWESQDEPEHLRTIRDRLLFNDERAGRLLGLYQQVLETTLEGELSDSAVPLDDSPEQAELLLSGLVEKHDGHLRIKNRIYRAIFNAEWVAQQLNRLRPYAQALNAWAASGYQDESRLLRGRALGEVLDWSQNKPLSDLDYKFLAACQELERREFEQKLEAERLHGIEAKLTAQKQKAKLQDRLTTVISFALLISTVLGVTAFAQFRLANQNAQQARISEVRALASSSEGLFASNRRLDALVEAIKAKRRSQAIPTVNAASDRQVDAVLRQAIYESDEFNRLSGHQAAIMSVAISPDSSLLASASVDKTVKLWRRDGSLMATLTGHKAVVRTVAFSPDGKLLVSGSDDQNIKLWTLDGKLVKTIEGHPASVWGVAFSSDGQLIASTSTDGTVNLWRTDGTLLRTLQGTGVGVWGVAFSPDSQRIAVAGFDRTVKIWDRGGKLLTTIKGHRGLLIGVAFSPDGQTLATASGDRTVRTWKLDGSPVNTFEGHAAAVYGVAFSPDGQTIVSASVDRTLKLWRTDGTALNTLSGHSAAIWNVAWSGDGSYIASAGTEGVVRLWQAKNPFRSIITANAGGTWGLDISKNGQTILTGTLSSPVKFWDRQGKLLNRTQNQLLGSVSLAFSPDETQIASASNGNKIGLWQNDGTLIKTFSGHSAVVWTVAFSPDGKTIASGGEDSTIKLWEVNRTCAEDLAIVPAARSSNSGQSSPQNSAQPSNCTPPKTLTGHSATVWQAVFSPDGKYIASASADGTVKLWRSDGTLLKTLDGHKAAVWRVAFSPDSKILATGSGDKTVKLWTLDGKLLRTLEGHTAGIWGVAFSPDGKKIASGSVDTTVRLWTIDGQQLTLLRGHSAAIRNLAYSPDSSFVASVGEDGSLILWNVAQVLNSDLLDDGCKHIGDYLRTNQDLAEKAPDGQLGDRHLCDR
ncbi:AAA-like domain-containing protein [Leptolyngbya ohadii]|uniref:WD40 domain-containing protein n=1 Tax=Leptolyngbya ohadii TaxID=1962290 RepID=UPI000B59E972|nr:AAA-like domain-containing protein [Leptolyngbya ohadii]